MHDSDKSHSTPLQTLLEVPANVAFRIESASQAVRELGYYALLGLHVGGFARVLAKYPERQPRFIELELENERISLPVGLAAQIRVSPVCAS